MKKINDLDAKNNTDLDISEGLIFNDSWIEYEDAMPSIKIGYGVKLTNCKITINKGGKLIIKDLCEIRGRIIIGENCAVEIGYGLVCNDAIFVQASEKGKITIKDDCLFANAKIYNSDQHSIFSIDSGERINNAADVVIGNRVWLARDTLLLKGAQIGDGSILGAKSVFFGSDSGSNLLVGSPAKEVKKNIAWSRHLTNEMSKLLPLDFPSSKFRSNALQFNHEEVINLGLRIWINRNHPHKHDYFALYYLARSLLLGPFSDKKEKQKKINGITINIEEIYESLMICFELSARKNIPCGCYAYLAANILDDKTSANNLYEIIKPLSNQIDNLNYKLK